ncbi:MAG: ABC transporter permease [Thermoanaerobaculia bacterium]
MSGKDWRTVLAKELKDALRDRRSLLGAFAYALLGPLALGVALAAVADRGEPDRPIQVRLAGAEQSPALVAALEAEHVQFTPSRGELEAEIAGGEAALGLRLRPGYGADFEALKPAEVELVYDSSRRETVAARERLSDLLRGYSQSVADQRLLARGILPASQSPLRLLRRDLASAAGRAAWVLGVLPLFLLMAAFVSGMNVAIDATAGERERGSLESLLLAPVGRVELVLGKALAGALVALAGSLITVALFYAVLLSPWLSALNLDTALGGREVLAILGILLPLCLLAPALEMLVGLGARSYKEGQTYVSLMMFLPMVPGFFLAYHEGAPAAWLKLVPVVGQQLLLADLLSARPFAGWAVAQGVLSLALAGGLVLAMARLLGRERIVLGR